MLITEEKEIKKFITTLNKINQVMKGVKEDNSYIIIKGICYTYPSPQTSDLGVTKLTILEPGGKKDNIDRYIKLINGSIDGISLYNFIRERKNEVKEVELCKTYIKFTLTDETIYTTNKLTNDNFDFSNYREFNTSIKSHKCQLISELELTDEIKEKMNSSMFPSLEIGDRIVRVTPKQFIKLTDKFENKASIHTYEGIKKLLALTTKNKEFECVQYYIVILED